MTHSDTTPAQIRLDREAVLAALTVAVRAPSIHNTQPWRWRLDPDGLVLLADRSRQLAVADPDGHSMLLSCGAALHATQLALEAAGWQIQTSRLPDPADPTVLARLHPIGRQEPRADRAAQVDAVLRRRSDRRPYSDRPVASHTVDALRDASSDSAAFVDFAHGVDERINLAAAVSWADRVERDDQAYVAEMQRWLRDPEVHAVQDGVPLDAIPHVPADQPRHTNVPLRDFEIGVTGRQMIERDIDERPLIAVVFTDADQPMDHLRAGAAMMRLMIEAEMLGLSSCPLSQAVDFAAFRTRVQGLMGWIGYPQMMVRIGYPTTPTADLPPTPRREPAAVLDIAG